MADAQDYARQVEDGWELIRGAFVIPGGGSNEVLKDPNDPTAGTRVETYDLRFPEEWLACATTADLARYKIKAILPADEPPAGHRILDRIIVTSGNKPKWQWVSEEIPLAERKAQALSSLDAAYAARLAAGYPHSFGDVAETLQCRNEHDRTNWLGLIKKCEVAIALGGGSAPVSPPIRCTSNRSYAVSHDEAYALMLALLDWAGEMMGAYWAHKDAIDAAGVSADIDSLDFSTGWPA